jgi:predicted nucleic acid-binding protein
MIVADTSVLIDFLQGSDTAASRKLLQLETEGTPVSIPLICVQEILQGAGSEKEWKALHDHLMTQDLLWPANPEVTHINAARIYYDCRRKGITVSGTVDCLIAQMVLDLDVTLLHDDDDYEKIRRVRPLKTMRQ